MVPHPNNLKRRFHSTINSSVLREQQSHQKCIPEQSAVSLSSQVVCSIAQYDNMQAGSNGQPEKLQVCLDETKRYFVLRRPDNEDIGDAGPTSILAIPKDQADRTFKEVCDKYECGVKGSEHIYCYGCDASSHGICPDHPLVFVIDTPVKMEDDAWKSLPSFLYVKESTIPNAGIGVFTRMFLPAGSAFGPYGGFMIRGDDDKAIHDYSWEIEVPKNTTELTVDASDPKRSNFLRWINCARFKEEQNMLCLQYHKRMYYVVFKPIYPDEELTVWYGDGYAKRLGIPNLRRCTDEYAPPNAKRDPKAMLATWPIRKGC